MIQNIKIAVDAVVFGYNEGQLYVLLIQQKFSGQDPYWALPGGLVKDNEPLSNAVRRELMEETNVTIKYLEQLYTFGDDIYRDSRNRVISVAYFALIDPAETHIKADTDAENVQWCAVGEVPALAFDHNAIVTMALQRLKAKLGYQPVGFGLLPEYFAFSDLENLYCTILEKEIDRRNFRKKVLSFGFVEETNKISDKKNGRPGKLYRFNQQKYNQLINEGMHFEIKFV
ncbi:NUDIX hydrolase [Flavobacterium akiainvivens]|uniref:NUDIX hydrolase n=1 Tax=Flavobacterium akiainvivens TaxID=1202724 RepID=A0A0M8MFU9_9FLAO|nr:NUDIX domain-containing protein [Flavobacterium akiainvivens]KOS04897.1 NUDIX hydrolase [Flavobacterium akiainvivens]SFQ42555.1 8-oxo-dGTP diphosphatase [Flavobacterium akiainvivens]